MNRRMVKEGMTPLDEFERVFKCDGCDWYFVTAVSGSLKGKARETAMTLEKKSMRRAWCPCKPWNIGAVEVGMRLPQGTVVRVDRLEKTVDVRLMMGDTEAPARRLPFSEVSPPQ